MAVVACSLDPSGRFLYSLNQHGDNVTTYRIDPKTGMPHFTAASCQCLQRRRLFSCPNFAARRTRTKRWWPGRTHSSEVVLKDNRLALKLRRHTNSDTNIVMKPLSDRAHHGNLGGQGRSQSTVRLSSSIGLPIAAQRPKSVEVGAVSNPAQQSVRRGNITSDPHAMLGESSMGIVTIDFEASCLPQRGRSYPIEVGIAGNKGSLAWLIQPPRQLARLEVVDRSREASRHNAQPAPKDGQPAEVGSERFPRGTFRAESYS